MSTSDGRMLTLRESLNEALREEMSRDPQVFLLGEDIGRAGGVFKVTAGLLDEFGSTRVIDTPISEAGIVAAAVGAATMGLRPVVEIMFCDFLTLAMDAIVNQAAKLRYMTGGQAAVPLVIRSGIGAGRRTAAQHSQSLHAWFSHIPGLRVVLPSSPDEAKCLLKQAIRSDDPVIFFEDKMAYGIKGEVRSCEPDDGSCLPMGVARVYGKGSDLVIVATSTLTEAARAAADVLAGDGIDTAVVDPRTLDPLDIDTIIAQVETSGRLLIVDPGHRSFGVTAELAAIVHERLFDKLRHPVMRIGAGDVPIPFSPILEDAALPDTEKIVNAAREMVAQ